MYICTYICKVGRSIVETFFYIFGHRGSLGRAYIELRLNAIVLRMQSGGDL
jgi:hypothetical protein